MFEHTLIYTGMHFSSGFETGCPEFLW